MSDAEKHIAKNRQGAPPEQEAVTALLIEAREGSADAINHLMPLVYDELSAIAHNKLRSERRGHTLDTRALVHEAYFRMVNQDQVAWQSRTHFYAVAALSMRRILVDYSRKHKASKRGGDVGKISLDNALAQDQVLHQVMTAISDEQLDLVLALDEALRRLEAFNKRGSMVVSYRFFGGLTNEQIAEVMGVSTITIKRAWKAARLWLRKELQEDASM